MPKTPFSRRATVACACALLAGSAALLARADEPPAEMPKPPTTPLPTFENPLHDCAVGETLRYVVREIGVTKPRWTRHFEERVIARTKDKALVETVEMDEGWTKVFSVDTGRSGWRPIPQTPVLGDTQRWLAEKEKDEVLYVGDPPTRAVRCRHRYLEEFESPGDSSGAKRVRQMWMSHDVPCTGKVKEFPTPGILDGERMAVSWDRTMTAEECAERAKRFGPADPPSGEAGMAEPAMSDPGMSDPGMSDEPGMGG